MVKRRSTEAAEAAEAAGRRAVAAAAAAAAADPPAPGARARARWADVGGDELRPNAPDLFDNFEADVDFDFEGATS